MSQCWPSSLMHMCDTRGGDSRNITYHKWCNNYCCSLYPSNNKVVGGFIGFTPSDSLSVRAASCVRSVAPIALVGSISYLHILLSNFRRCVMCKVCCKILKLEFLEFFLICNFDFVLFWLGISCKSLGNHGAAGGISERRHSSCSLCMISMAV